MPIDKDVQRELRRLEKMIERLKTPERLQDSLAFRRDLVDLGNVPSAHAHLEAAQTLTTNGWRHINLDTIDWDYMGDAVDLTNNEIVARRAGLYLICVNGGFAADATGTRFAGYGIDSATPVRSDGGNAVSSFSEYRIGCTDVQELDVGEAVWLLQYHTKGTDLNTATGTDTRPSLFVGLLANR